VDLVRSRIDEFLDGRTPILASIAPEASAFERFSRDFLRFGKRYRALFCYWGWQAVQDPDDGEGPGVEDLSPIVSAASALELFHAAALVHDDLIDSSDTRRGMPSAHRLFEREHASREWVGDAAGFGRSSAVLLGDLLLCWADELFDDAAQRSAIREDGRAARSEFNRMRLEVTAGQYLDIVAEAAWPHVHDAEAVRTAERVIVFKSAKYSIESPLVIGATLGGASLPQLSALRAFGLPLGIAFQLRDDLLGVFGDSEVTGKPAGDDLLEGKRTVLVALTRQALPVSARRTVDELLGDPDLDAEQIRMLQDTIRASGAIDEVERLISANVDRARAAIEDAPISPEARDALWALADSVTVRTS
jgi:geranylgeranyl diphosphate synthase type I